MTILEVKNLCKSYKNNEIEVKAVDDVSFTVDKGEFVAVIGASGSGKSTLLHMIGGVDLKDSGQIIVGGSDISNLTSDELAIYRRREVGIVYQFYNLIPTLTVEENISIPYRLDNKRVPQDLMDTMLKNLNLSDKRNNLPNQLSGGQQQRTSIGRALINSPSILLADEPTGNLDSKSSNEIAALLKNYNKVHKQTIIMVTHNPELANIADRIIEMADGKIISDVRN